jgi:hypothetical protein
VGSNLQEHLENLQDTLQPKEVAALETIRKEKALSQMAALFLFRLYRFNR